MKEVCVCWGGACLPLFPMPLKNVASYGLFSHSKRNADGRGPGHTFVTNIAFQKFPGLLVVSAYIFILKNSSLKPSQVY